LAGNDFSSSNAGSVFLALSGSPAKGTVSPSGPLPTRCSDLRECRFQSRVPHGRPLPIFRQIRCVFRLFLVAISNEHPHLQHEPRSRVYPTQIRCKRSSPPGLCRKSKSVGLTQTSSPVTYIAMRPTPAALPRASSEHTHQYLDHVLIKKRIVESRASARGVLGPEEVRFTHRCL